MLNVSDEDILQGSIVKTLIFLAIPLTLQNVVQIAQQVVDTFWVGQLGANAVAAIGVVFPLVAALYFVHVGLYTGTRILVAQRLGDGDRQGARRTVFHGGTLMFVTGLVIAGFVWTFGETLVELIGPGGEVNRLAAVYLSTVILGLPIMGLSDALEGGFVSDGDTKAAFIVNTVAVVVNIGLDPFLILGWGPFPRYGIFGAAVASVVGYTAGFAVAFGMALGYRDTLQLRIDAIGFQRSLYREIVGRGYAIGIKRLTTQLSGVAIVALLSYIAGPAGLVAYTIGTRVSSVAVIPAWGLQQASETVIGQNIGAEKFDRVVETTWIGLAIAFVVLGTIGAVQWALPQQFATLFVPTLSGSALEFTVVYLKILAYTYWAVGILHLFFGGFNAANRTRVSLVTALVRDWGLKIPIAVLSWWVLGLGVVAVFWSFALATVATTFGIAVYYGWAVSNDRLVKGVSQTQ